MCCRIKRRVRQIPLRDAAYGQRPSDSKGGVVVAHAPCKLGTIDVGHHVDHFAIVAERLKAMSHPLRDIQSIVASIVQHQADVLYERRRCGTKIQDHILDSTPSTPNQFALCGSWPCKVHAAQRTCTPVVRNACLLDTHADPVCSELVAAPDTREKATFVLMTLNANDERPRDRNGLKDQRLLQNRSASICFVRCRYFNCFKRVNARKPNTSGVNSIRSNRWRSSSAPCWAVHLAL